MIFVCVGSRKSQFNRLVKKIDELVSKGAIKEEVIAQIGVSDYIPQNITYHRFLSKKEFDYYQDKADVIISHAGTGALIGALKKGKKVIAVPRLQKFGEHIDDHQIQIASVLEKQGYLKCVIDIDTLEETINNLVNGSAAKKYNRESKVIDIIEEFLKNN